MTEPVIRLIATDLDGTLLRSDRTVSQRTRSALDAARKAGMIVVPVTARQPNGLRLIAEQAGFEGYAICGNGAHGIHLRRNETLFEEHLQVPAQTTLALALSAAHPQVRFASVRQRGSVFVAQEGYADLAEYQDHKRHPHEMGRYALNEVLDAPSLKFIARSPLLSPRELHLEVLALKPTLNPTLSPNDFSVTHSGAPFLEILAPGVNKAWGLAKLCALLGVPQSEVLAFGDATNDAELLRWAGRGVAMANAEPEALQAANETTLSNDEDGVAVVIERLLKMRANR